MHNDVYSTQEQNICQVRSRRVYRAKTSPRRHPLKYTGTLLPRNLCKLQKQNVALQNVALQWRITRGRQSHLRPLTLATTWLEVVLRNRECPC
jgi:hypothetical protein